MEEQQIGYVSKFFDRISVAAIEITEGEIREGDTIHIKGHTTDYKGTVQSMQIENSTVTSAKKGDAVGIKVGEKVRRKDKVYKITE